MATKSKRSLDPDLYSANCPSRLVLNNVTSTWGSLVLVLLLGNTFRFSELRDHIGGISEKMLTQSLRNLEADGFVARKVYPVVPAKVEYSLTPLGTEVAERVKQLTVWVEKNLGEVMKARRSHQASSKTTRSKRPL